MKRRTLAAVLTTATGALLVANLAAGAPAWATVTLAVLFVPVLAWFAVEVGGRRGSHEG